MRGICDPPNAVERAPSLVRLLPKVRADVDPSEQEEEEQGEKGTRMMTRRRRRTMMSRRGRRRRRRCTR